MLAAERDREYECFLSVVVRTQAKRWEQLQDALLCLAAQTDRDFEVLIMLHEAEERSARELREFVQTYPEEFRSRVRFEEVVGGGRTRPLAAALPHLRGRYVAFFDDDDLLMANWVEDFHASSRVAPGRVLRSNVATQLNRSESWGEGAVGQRTISAASAEYKRRFSMLDHVQVNHTPFMGVAFPVSLFRLWGEDFDEELPVCEDWDIIMRAAGLLGVHSSDALTAIYRQWESAQTSYTSHDGVEWRNAEARVRQKIDEAPYFTPEGSVDEVLEVLEREHAVGRELGTRLSETLSSTSWRLTEPLRRVIRRLRALLTPGRS